MRKTISLLLVLAVMVMFSSEVFADISSAKSLFDSGKYIEARVVYMEVVTAGGVYATEAQVYVGFTYEAEKDIPKAREEYTKATTMSDPFHATLAQIFLGDTYALEKNYIQAQKEYILVIQKKAPVSVLSQVLDKLDATIIGKDVYIECLNKMILIVPAKAENAEFLGVLKSEIEKLK